MSHSSFSFFLVIFSVFIGIISSYTTLVFVERIFDGNRTKRMIWLLSGAFVMGTGIFAMHFIAMIAFHLDSPMTYDVFLLVLSFLSGILSSFAAFFVLYLQPLSKTKAMISGLIIGLGIVLLHYIATFAIYEQVQINFKSFYFTLSILISLGFSTIAINFFVKMKEDSQNSIIRNVLSAVVLGLTITFMHYTGMKATLFIGHSHDHLPAEGIDAFILGVAIAFITLAIMIVALISAFLDYRSLHAERRLLRQLKESEARYRRLVELSPEPIIVHDDQVVLFVNEASLSLLHSVHKSELVGKPLMNFVHPDYREIVSKHIQVSKHGELNKFYELKIMALDKTIKDVEIVRIGILYENKPAFQLVIRDISEQKRIKEELDEKQQRYQSLFEHHPDPVFSLDHQGNFIEMNAPVLDILGYSKEELLSMSFVSVIEPSDLELSLAKFKEALNGVTQEYEIVAISKNGVKIPASVKNIPIIVNDKIIGVYGIAKDMSKEKEALRKIQDLAYTDQLTDLPNRTWFNKNLEKVIKRAKDQDSTIAILLVDFDNFKNVNDTLGHHIGDLFLREISKRLKDSLGEHHIIARLGGDEFIILLENVTKANVRQIAQRLLHDMNQVINILGHELFVTLSIGISMNSDCTVDKDTLIQHADVAMYDAKEKGKNNYQFFTEALHERITRKSNLENSLRKAVENQELSLYYQPLVDIQTGKLQGVEALLRWRSSFGFVSPAEFIPIAEDTGLIIQIGEWVIQEACRQRKQWQDNELLQVPISVNVSARQFKESNFTHRVKQIVQKEMIDPHSLEIEITESVMMNVEHSSKVIHELQEFGIKVAIDDFGAGYSSLQLIASLDFDTLKIDKSIIDDSNNKERKMVILDAIIRATENFKRIIVEGIETKEQVESLKKYSIIGQGYFFSRPLPPEELEDKVKEME